MLLLMLNQKNRYATVVSQAAHFGVWQEKLRTHLVDFVSAFLGSIELANGLFVSYCRMRMNLATKFTPKNFVYPKEITLSTNRDKYSSINYFFNSLLQLTLFVCRVSLLLALVSRLVEQLLLGHHELRIEHK